MADASHPEITVIVHRTDANGVDEVVITFDDGSEEREDATWASANSLARHAGLDVVESLDQGVTRWSRRPSAAHPWRNPLL